MTKDEQWLLEEKYGGIEGPAYAADKARLAQGEPVAYVIGWQPFLGMKIYLDSKSLIPRAETEWWVEQLIGEVLRRQSRESARSGPLGQVLPASSAPSAPYSLRLLDLCAGSGAIGCAVLKSIPDAQVSFGEIDAAHEATIRKNIRENGLDEARADIRVGDLFVPFAGERFDYIAANPPYIPEARALPASVADYEPALALRSGADGLALMRRIAEGLKAHLTDRRLPAGRQGEAWVECDEEHSEAARGLFRAHGYSAEIRPDQFGRPRVVVIS